MRKFLLAASVAGAFLMSSIAASSAMADHGHYGAGYGGYRAPDCHTSHYHSGYAPHYSGYGGSYGYGGGRITQYSSAIVPVYRGGVYQSYSFGSPAHGFPGYGPAGFPFAVPQYSAGYGSGYYGSGFSNPVPRVQLRIGF